MMTSQIRSRRRRRSSFGTARSDWHHHHHHHHHYHVIKRLLCLFLSSLLFFQGCLISNQQPPPHQHYHNIIIIRTVHVAAIDSSPPLTRNCTKKRNLFRNRLKLLKFLRLDFDHYLTTRGKPRATNKSLIAKNMTGEEKSKGIQKRELLLVLLLRVLDCVCNKNYINNNIIHFCFHLNSRFSTKKLCIRWHRR